MRKVIFFLMMFSLSCPLVACGDSREGMKLAKEPFDSAKCETYQNLSKEALKKNENDIVDALTNYIELCWTNMDKLKGLSKQKGMRDPR